MNTAGKRYVIGLDFGALTARGILVDVSDGKEAAVSICGYQDAEINRTLPEYNLNLPVGFSLQNPQDYEHALESILKDVWRKAGVDPRQVIGVGVAFTASTVMPLDKNMRPLCENVKYRKNPHSWVKTWNHRSAREEAGILSRAAAETGADFIHNYGGLVSGQTLFPKVLETYREAPAVYNAAHCFVEAGDWLVYLLTGDLKKSSDLAGFKALWDMETGYPPEEFFSGVDAGFRDVVKRKLAAPVAQAPGPAGRLCTRMAEITGLSTDTMVALCSIDAHSAFFGSGVASPNTLAMSIGMCSCFMLASPVYARSDMCVGIIRSGLLPGYFGYETAQPAVGEMLDWYIGTGTADKLLEEAVKHNEDLYTILNRKMADIKPGTSGLLALDWWNGDGSYLRLNKLGGLLAGMNLSTTSDEIYRALVEASAFGARRIVEDFESSGIAVERICASGAIALNAPQIMQVYADVIGRPICVSHSRQAAALGAAMCAAVAAGAGRGGYDTIFDSVKYMSRPPEERYFPNAAYRDVYERLYGLYRKLQNYFAGEGLAIMEDLHGIRAAMKEEKI